MSSQYVRLLAHTCKSADEVFICKPQSIISFSFKTSSSVSQAILELTMQLMMILNSNVYFTGAWITACTTTQFMWYWGLYPELSIH